MKILKLKKINSTVCIGEKITANLLKKIFTNYQQENIFLVSDKNVYQEYQNWLQKILPTENILCLPAGEQIKSFTYLQKIYTFLLKKKAHRKSLLIAFGGGVIGDLVGFAAASFLRGINLIQIPTSLLAQVDSSVGGKTGINHHLAKNTIGAFYQPSYSIIDTDFLKTLPRRQLACGYAEIFKHALIQDKKFFLNLQKIKKIQQLQQDIKHTNQLVTHSCKIKLAVVEKDEKEAGLRAILNFGHTLAHWIEAHTNYQEYLHGEAVFGGMDFALWWSRKHLLLAENQYQQAKKYLLIFATTICLTKVTQQNFSSIIAKDKKNYSNGIAFIGIDKIGHACIVPKVQLANLWQDFVEYLQSPQPIIRLQ